jgi:hypothetical protein
MYYAHFITKIDAIAIRAIGYSPDTFAPSSLVWDRDSKTLYVEASTYSYELVLTIYSYFIGFRHRNVITGQPRHTVPDVKSIAYFGLAKPNSRAWLKEGWDQDMTEWKW